MNLGFLLVPLEVGGDKRWVSLGAPGAGAHVAGCCVLAPRWIDSVELSGFEMKCSKSFEAIYKDGSRLKALVVVAFRFLFGGALHTLT